MTLLMNQEILVRLLVALGLGMIIGLERFVAHKTAGMRTYSLISMGSALFVIISILATVTTGSPFFDYHIVAQIIAGAGFIGAGVVFHKQDQTVGLTTASGLWVSAGIGMAAGFGFYWLAIITASLTLFIFTALYFIEIWVEKIEKKTGLGKVEKNFLDPKSE